MRIKKQLNKELDGIVKEFDRNRDLALRVETARKTSAHKKPQRSKKVWIGSFSALAAAIVAVLAVCLSLPLSAGPSSPEYFSIEINPSVIMSVENGKVERVISMNEDCDILLSEGFRETLIGLSAADAAAAYVDRAVRLGFIDKDDVAALKLSTQKDSTAKLLGDTIDGYFMSAGVYAVVATGSIDEYTVGAALDGGDVFSLRNIENMSTAELSESFSERIMRNINGIMRSGLSSRIDKMSEYKRLIDELSVLNEKIQDHPDNPVTLSAVKDYYVVDGLKFLYPPSGYTEQFAELMSEFRNVSDSYISLGGSEISNGVELESVRIAFEALPLDALRQILDKIDGITEELRSAVAEVLKFTGFDMSEVIAVAETLPSTVDEYINKINVLCSAEAEMLFAEHKHSYEKERPALSSDQYESFIADILKEYGSLDKYFETTNKRNR